MSNMINPILVDGFLEEEQEGSAQGCFQGSDYWYAERATDLALKRERELRAEEREWKEKLTSLEEQLKWCNPKHTNKMKRLETEIKRVKTHLHVLQQKHSTKL